MNPPKLTGIALPRHWSPEQALAAYELTGMLREKLWLLYGPDIQKALRRRQRPRQLQIPPRSRTTVLIHRIRDMHRGRRRVSGR